MRRTPDENSLQGYFSPTKMTKNVKDNFVGTNLVVDGTMINNLWKSEILKEKEFWLLKSRECGISGYA